MSADVHLRWMIRRDMLRVLAIESHSFDWPWSEDDFIAALRQRNIIGMVAEMDDCVVGFLIYKLQRNGLEILNIAVHEDFRRCGVASSMVLQLISKLHSQRRTTLSLHVRETNLQAQKFFRHWGFRAVSVEPRFYDDTKEDSYYMVFDVNQDIAEGGCLARTLGMETGNV